jgi:hypothetical protein
MHAASILTVAFESIQKPQLLSRQNLCKPKAQSSQPGGLSRSSISREPINLLMDNLSGEMV